MRDRLDELQQNAARKHWDSEEALFPFDRPEAEDPLLKEENDAIWTQLSGFLRRCEELWAQARLLESYVGDFCQRHSLILQSPTPEKELQDELDATMGAFERLSLSLTTAIQELAADVPEQTEATASAFVPADVRIRWAQLSGLSKRVLEIQNSYQGEVARHQAKCQKRIRNFLELTGVDASDAYVNEMVERGQIDRMFSSAYMVGMSERSRAVALLADSQSRLGDILKLEQSVRQLRDLFVHMAVMIEEQGEMVDKIEFHIQYSKDKTQHARHATKQAAKFRDKYQKMLRRCLGLRTWVRPSVLAPFSSAAAESDEVMRKRLLYQSKKRGILENDILLGGFAAKHLKDLDRSEMSDFDALINGDHNEWDIYYWLSDTAETPSEVETPVWNKLKTFAWSDERVGFRYKQQKVHVIK